MKTLLCLVTIALAATPAALAHTAAPVRCAPPAVACQRPVTIIVRTVPVCAAPVPLSPAYWCRPALPINTYCVPSAQPPSYSVQSFAPCLPVIARPCRVRGW